MVRVYSKPNLTFATIAVCLLLCGCQSIQTGWNASWFGEAPAATVPDRILVIWADTVLHQPGKPGIRGFGGRLYFYRDGETDPVTVDGSVTVYVFDGEALDPNRAAPLKKYVVTADQFAGHHSKTSLGDSYNIWVPWDRVGGPNRVFSLVVRFDGREGGTVLGQPSTKLLPGVAASDHAPFPIRRASHELTVEKDEGTANAQSGISSLTIDLPPSFQRRLIGEQTRPQPPPGPRLNPPPPSLATPTAQTTSPRKEPTTREEHERSQPSAHSLPGRFPARRAPRVQPGRAPLRRLPHPAGWPSALPPTPRAGIAPRSEPTPTAPPSVDVPSQ